MKGYIVEIGVTDHYPTILHFDKINMVGKRVLGEKQYRNFKDIQRVTNFMTELDSVEWQHLSSEEQDVCERFEAFDDKLRECFNKHFPIMTKTIRTKSSFKPWMTNKN